MRGYISRGPPFVGRRKETTTLDADFRALLQSQFRCVLLEGEPGVGKTRLAAEFLERHSDKAVTMRARGHTSRSSVAFALWADLFDGYLRGRSAAEISELCGGFLDDLAGLLRTVAAVHGRWRDDVTATQLQAGLTTLLSNISSRHPVIILLDDVHLADPSSWDTLGKLAHDLAASPVLVLACARPGQRAAGPTARQVLFGIEQDGALTRSTVRPLAEDAVGELVSRVLADPVPSARLVSWLQEKSRCNPLYAVTLLDALRAQGRDLADPKLDAIPANLAERVEARMEDLDPRAREVLDLLAVVGWRVRPDELVRLGVNDLEVLDTLVQARLVEVHEDAGELGYEPHHPMVEEVVYRNIGPQRRRALHHHVACVLTETDRIDDAVPHFVKSASPTDADAIAALIQGLRQAWSRATYPQAFVVLHALTQLLADSDRRWIDVLEAMPLQQEFSVLFNRLTSDTAKGLEALRRIQLIVQSQQLDSAKQGLVQHYLAALLGSAFAEFDQASACAESATRLFTEGGQHACARISQHHLTWFHALAGRFADQEKVGRALLEQAQSAHDLRAQSTALGAVAAANYARGDFDNAAHAFRRADGNDPQSGLALLADVLQQQRPTPHAQHALRDAAVAERPIGTPLVLDAACRFAFFAGDYAWLLEVIGPLIPRMNAVPRGWLTSLLAAAAAEAGDGLTARRYLSASETLFPDCDIWLARHGQRWATGVLALAAGKPLAAARAFDKAAGDLLALGVLPLAVSMLTDLTEAAMLAHRPEIAGDAADRAQQVAGQLFKDRYRALAELATATHKITRASHGNGAEHAHRALELLDGHDFRAVEARCHAHLGTAYASTDRATAVHHYESAASLFAACGSFWRRERVLGKLRELGKPGRRAADAALGPQGLSSREREIAAFAAGGLTAKEIGARLHISSRTVETHLAHTYAKLAVRTRQDLAAALDR